VTRKSDRRIRRKKLRKRPKEKSPRLNKRQFKCSNQSLRRK
jgi:hypothetical protein